MALDLILRFAIPALRVVHTQLAADSISARLLDVVLTLLDGHLAGRGFFSATPLPPQSEWTEDGIRHWAETLPHVPR